MVLFASCKLDIEPELDPSITYVFIDSLPTKTKYVQNETLDLDGLIINSVLSDGTIKSVTDYTTSINNGVELAEIGTITILVTYEDFSTSFSIEVTKAPAPSKIFIDSLPTKTTYSICENFDTTGLVLKEIYTNGEIKEITDYSISPAPATVLNSLGENKATITYNEQTLSFSYFVTMKKTGLPTVTISTNNTPIVDKENWIPGTIKIENAKDSEWNFDEIELSIKGRGNTSWGQPKKPYTLKLGEKNKILGMGKSKKWVLIANYSDKTLSRNNYASFIGNNIFTNMKWNPSFKPVDLILNGIYEGTYLLGEQIKIEKNRVNIQNVADTVLGDGDDLNNDGTVNEKDGGFIVEVNTTRMDEDYNYRTTKGIGMSLSDPDVDDFSGNVEKVESYIANIIQTAEDVLYSDNWLDNETGYKKYIDVDSFIDWYLVNEFTKNNDAVWFSSVYMYYEPEDGKLHMGPDWDFDISCGNIDYNGCDNYEGFWIKDSGWHERLFTDPDFIARTKMRWNAIKEELKDSVDMEIQNMADYISISANLNFIEWDILGKYVWPNAAGYEKRTTFQSEVDYMKKWLEKRYLWLDNAIINL